MLKVLDLETGYGKKVVVKGISLEVSPGEITAIIGPNGAGKSTVLKAIFGLLRVSKGKVIFRGEEIQNREPSLNVRAGLSYVPQGSRVFTELTALENLEVGGYTIRNNELKVRIEQVFELFPLLKARRNQTAGSLSGGEKQMLSLGRALILKPSLLLLDEPSLGLSVKLGSSAIEKIKEINDQFNTSFLIVEQNIREILSISQNVYILKLGTVISHDMASNLSEQRLSELFLS